MCQVAALDVPMCKPLEFGISGEGVYSIQTWIEGVDAEENAHSLTSDEQYFYGFEAGRILKEIHKIPAPEGIEDWEIYYNRKADHKSGCMKNALSSMKTDKHLLITLTLTGICSAVVLKLISTEITISAI